MVQGRDIAYRGQKSRRHAASDNLYAGWRGAQSVNETKTVEHVCAIRICCHSLRMSQAAHNSSVRVDKWLWAARFFKTRSLAAKAVKGGHVQVNEQRAKASVGVHVDDRLRVSKGEAVFEIDVLGLSEQRGPAAQAMQLYAETAASREQREAGAAERRAARLSMPRPAARPDKKQRRQLRRFKQGE